MSNQTLHLNVTVLLGIFLLSACSPRSASPIPSPLSPVISPGSTSPPPRVSPTPNPLLPTNTQEFTDLFQAQAALSFRLSVPLSLPVALPLEKVWVYDYADGDQRMRILYAQPGEPLDSRRKSVSVAMLRAEDPLSPESIQQRIGEKGLALDIQEVSVRGQKGWTYWQRSGAGGNWATLEWREGGINFKVAFSGDWPAPTEKTPHDLDPLLLQVAFLLTPLPVASPTPTTTATGTPVPTSTPDIIATVTAAETPYAIQEMLSPDGRQRAKVIRYECLSMTSWQQSGQEPPPQVAYEELRLVNVETGSETLVDTEMQYCGGLGAYGLGIEFWSSDSRYLYYSDAYYGVPDGGGYWERPLTRLDTTNGKNVQLSLGSISPDKTMLVSSYEEQVTIWSIDHGDILHLPYAQPAKHFCGAIWSPDSRALIYKQGGCDYPLMQVSFVRLDLEHGTQELFAESGAETISRVEWKAPHSLFLGSECRKTWTIDPYQYSATHLWTPPAWTAPLYPLVPTEGVLNSTLQCSPGGIYNHCSDKLLGIDFDISSSLGKIDTQLRMGGYCGYAYDYSFPAQATQPKTSTWAGGRSWDFSEGRGGWFTDYYGWGSSSAEVACSWYPDTFCQIIRPEVIFKIYLPTAEDFCTSGPYSGPDAMGIVNVNLPENQAVNGFTFVSRLLSDRDQQALNAILGYSDQGNSPQCDAEHIQQYEAKRNAILQYFREGQGMPFDRETLDNIERILQIARSIKIR